MIFAFAFFIIFVVIAVSVGASSAFRKTKGGSDGILQAGTESTPGEKSTTSGAAPYGGTGGVSPQDKSD